MAHGSELYHSEDTSVEAKPLLQIEHRTPVFQLDRDGGQEENRGKNSEGDDGGGDVQHALQRKVYRAMTVRLNCQYKMVRPDLHGSLLHQSLLDGRNQLHGNPVPHRQSQDPVTLRRGDAGVKRQTGPLWNCLLYTSDAADDLLCVDLGGR